jgi:hypothetical protein
MASMVIALHIWHLLLAAWSSTVESMATSTVAIFVALVVFFARGLYGQGLAFVRTHLKQSLGEGALWAVGAWLVLFAVNIVKTIYNDHQHFVQTVVQMRDDAASPPPTKFVGLGYVCELSNLPTEIPGHGTIELLPIEARSRGYGLGSSGFVEAHNNRNKPSTLIQRSWLKDLKTPADRIFSIGMASTRRCTIRNDGNKPLQNVLVSFEFDFGTNEKTVEEAPYCRHRVQVLLSEIDSGKSFVFYVFSNSQALTLLRFGRFAIAATPDSESEMVGLRALGAVQRDETFPFNPSKLRWGGVQPEDKYTCQKLPPTS